MTNFKDKKTFTPKRYTIRFTVVSIFILATLITATIAIGLQYHFSKKMAVESTQQIFSLTSDKTQEGFSSLDRNAEQITRLLATLGDFIQGNNLNQTAYSLFAESLKNNNEFYAIYVGFPNGNFHQLVNLNASSSIRKQMHATNEDRWLQLIVNNESDEKTATYQYLDSELSVRSSKRESSDYEVTARPWYLNAQYNTVYKTKPYLFKHLREPGQTYSIKIPNTEIVLAVDIALSSFSQYLTKQEQLSIDNLHKEVYLFQRSGEVIASNQQHNAQQLHQHITKLPLNQQQRQLIANTPTLRVSNELDWAPIDFSIAGEPMGLSIDILTLISSMTGLTFEYSNGLTWPELIMNFENKKIDVLQPIFKTSVNNKKGLYTKPFIDLPLSLVTLPNTDSIGHIEQLKEKTLAIPSGWSIIPLIKENYPKIRLKEYPSSKAVLDAVATGEAYAGLDTQAIFQYTQKQFFIDNIKYHTNIKLGKAHLDTSLHFMLHKSQHALVDIFNLAIDKINDKHYQELHERWFKNPTNSSEKKLNDISKVVPYQALIEEANNIKNYGKLTEFLHEDVKYLLYLTPITAHQDEFIAIVVNSDYIYDQSLEKVKISIILTTLILFLTLPISWIFSSPIVKPVKLLALENEKVIKGQYNKVRRIYSNIKEVDALGVSLLKMSESIENHVKKQEALMDSFIQLIAQTIDDKSPYTGGHCNRVPDLGMLLVKAAEKDTNHFKDFSFKSRDEWREFKVSAWLHDCGKIITPEHIVDKGSKLETIYNRIHEIRMRFEVLWRDAEITYYQALIAQPSQQEALYKALTEQQQKLINDFNFVASTNVGGEFMDEDKVVKLHKIAQQTWQRHFDDTLGLSPVEELHIAEQSQNSQQELEASSQALPVTEMLLADKAQHIFKRKNQLAFDEKFGIKMSVPEHQANLGELYNLSISRGTLTVEDRFIINEHIIETIKMLDQLPFPPELANVPKYASTHHETLIGTGYPRKLTADDLTIPERVLVIADIFEALTAADRPYKKAKSLSASINILHKFALDQHIDIDLFELFLTSGVYLTYANKYMHVDQIDEVDISKYIRS
ncbi:HD domain-containing phosphohydrolase [Colwellia sp. E2M01]|uniref:HD domain-containing phosphohydrolase n=1 Tax=Colwellia sp. E2M01 TaxID=2841561 RepID=UPI001C08DB7D|nr:HD domain-containing phosphohydrolase [Colwellia sp. E2M01]MBU2870872.1 transporter substrate-binding domain-containing protein [Colwellia sp. E2M01]